MRTHKKYGNDNDNDSANVSNIEVRASSIVLGIGAQIPDTVKVQNNSSNR